MTYCPSQGWDAEVARQDSAALASTLADLHSLAEKCFLAQLANSAQNTAKMAPEDLARDAYHAAAALIQARYQIEGGATGYTNVQSRLRKDEAKTWDERFWVRWGEDLIP